MKSFSSYAFVNNQVLLIWWIYQKPPAEDTKWQEKTPKRGLVNVSQTQNKNTLETQKWSSTRYGYAGLQCWNILPLPHFPVSSHLLQTVQAQPDNKWTRLSQTHTHTPVICSKANKVISHNSCLSHFIFPGNGFIFLNIRQTRGISCVR